VPVSEGELTPEQAIEEQRKIKLPATGSDQPARDLGALPPRLRELIEQSVKLQARVIRLDRMLGYKQLPAFGRGGASAQDAAVAPARRVRY
jgi:regulator of CtrA degradation